MTNNLDAAHAARALLGGHVLDMTADQIFYRLEANPKHCPHELIEARRVLDALIIGSAAEALANADPTKNRMPAAFRLARAVRKHLVDRRRGWFRFLLRLGAERSDIPFHLSFSHRAHSSTAQLKGNLDMSTNVGRIVNNSIVAASILMRIETGKANGKKILVKGAIEAAINEGDITTEEEAARLSWQEFCRYCRALTPSPGTYRLKIYQGSIELYRGRWAALPDVGDGSQPLPASKGGAPRKT